MRILLLDWLKCSRFVFLGIAVASTVHPGSVQAQEALITLEEIKRISPKADNGLATAFVSLEERFRDAGIDTRLRMAHFVAQVMTETGGLSRLDENLSYSYERAMRVFSRKTLPEPKARELARKPREFANWVYGSRLGNLGRHTQDGWDYRGSGFIQLTGRANFRQRGLQLGLPLESNPELVRNAKEGMMAAVAYWSARGVNAAADDNDALRVRILINGPAAHGIEQSKVWFGRSWTRVFKAKQGTATETTDLVEPIIEEGELFDEILQESGLLPEGFESEADPNEARAEAIKSFQREVGLPSTGELDAATQDELLDPREWRHRGDAELLPIVPETDLEQSVSFQMDKAEVSTEASAPFPTEPSMGTGAVVADVNMLPEDQAALARANSIYSEYEMGDAAPKPEAFVPFTVIGNDDRAPVEDTRPFPMRAIVQILFEAESGRQHLCSGALVSRDTVLTAGHCVHSGTISGKPYRNFRVTPGRNIGAAPFGRCKAVKAYVLSGWSNVRTPQESRYYDLGALKLDCSVGEVTGWFGIRSLDDGEIGLRTVVHGYAGDLAPTGRQWISKDQLRILTEFKGFYMNDTFGGTSGAPVYDEASTDVLIGVHTNGLHGSEEPWKTHNGFTRITPERLGRIQEWIAE